MLECAGTGQVGPTDGGPTDGGSPADPAAYAALPERLRPHAEAIHQRFVQANGPWAASRAEILAAIASPGFRIVLEQEARLNGLSLAR